MTHYRSISWQQHNNNINIVLNYPHDHLKHRHSWSWTARWHTCKSPKACSNIKCPGIKIAMGSLQERLNWWHWSCVSCGSNVKLKCHALTIQLENMVVHVSYHGNSVLSYRFILWKVGLVCGMQCIWLDRRILYVTMHNGSSIKLCLELRIQVHLQHQVHFLS